MNIFEIVLTQPLANGIILFYKLLFNNMGLAIIGFTVFLKFLLNPLTKPYMNSMKKIKETAPLLEKLKRKYPNDKMKFAQAQADLYKQRGIKPTAGCLPYLLQIAVLIAFFNVFTKTLSPNTDTIQSFNKLLYSPLKISQEEIINTKFLYLDLKDPDTVKLFGISLPGPILIAAAVLQLLSAKSMGGLTQAESAVAKKTKSKEDDIQVSMQKSMTYTFPLMTLIIGLKFPSGLALYWLMFSLFQLIQQSQGGLKSYINLKNVNSLIK